MKASHSSIKLENIIKSFFQGFEWLGIFIPHFEFLQKIALQEIQTANPVPVMKTGIPCPHILTFENLL